MLHCNMTTSLSLQQGLEGLLADMRRERRAADLGRLAFLAYCEVRRWAREAGDGEIAAQAAAVATGSPHASRAAFLAHIDELIGMLESRRGRSCAGVSELQAKMASTR